MIGFLNKRIRSPYPFIRIERYVKLLKWLFRSGRNADYVILFSCITASYLVLLLVMDCNTESHFWFLIVDFEFYFRSNERHHVFRTFFDRKYSGLIKSIILICKTYKEYHCVSHRKRKNFTSILFLKQTSRKNHNNENILQNNLKLEAKFK